MKLIIDNVEYSVIYCAHTSDKLYVNCTRDNFSEILEAVEQGSEIGCIADNGSSINISAKWAIESTYFVNNSCKLTFKKMDSINSILAQLGSQESNLINAETDIANLQTDNISFREELLDTQEAIAELYESLI